MSIGTKRDSEKVDELLFMAFSMLEKNDLKRAFSMYTAVLRNYHGNYSAIKVNLTTAKNLNLLPKHFKIPQNSEAFLKYTTLSCPPPPTR